MHRRTCRGIVRPPCMPGPRIFAPTALSQVLCDRLQAATTSASASKGSEPILVPDRSQTPLIAGHTESREVHLNTAPAPTPQQPKPKHFCSNSVKTAKWAPCS